MKKALAAILAAAVLLAGCGYSPPDQASPPDSSFHKTFHDPTNGISVDVACGHWTGGGMNEADCLITVDLWERTDDNA